MCCLERCERNHSHHAHDHRDFDWSEPGDNYFAAGGSLTYSNVDDLQILTGSAADVIEVGTTHSGSTLIDTGGGADQITVKSTTGLTSLRTGVDGDTIRVAPAIGMRESIGGVLQIDGGADGSDVLVVDDHNTVEAVVDLAFARVEFGGAMPIIYEGMDQLELRLGPGSDVVHVLSTHAGSTSIDTDGGADQIHVRSTGGPLLLLTGDDSDLVSVSSPSGALSEIGGPLQVFAGIGDEDVLIVDDSGNSAGRTFEVTAQTVSELGSAQIEYESVDDLRVSLGNGDDEVRVLSTHAGETLIETGGGQDQIFVESIAGATSLLSGEGDDSIRVSSSASRVSGIGSGLNVSAGDGLLDKLIVDDRGNTVPQSVVLTSQSISGLSTAQITYADIDQLELYLGSGSDTIDVTSTHAGSTQVDTGGGLDDLQVRSTTGPTTVVSGADGATIRVGSTTDHQSVLSGIGGELNVVGATPGMDTLIVDDRGNSASATVVLSVDHIVGFSPALLGYQGNRATATALRRR